MGDGQSIDFLMRSVNEPEDLLEFISKNYPSHIQSEEDFEDNFIDWMDWRIGIVRDNPLDCETSEDFAEVIWNPNHENENETYVELRQALVNWIHIYDIIQDLP